MQDTATISFDDIKIEFDSAGKNNNIVITLPCGCENKILPDHVNSLGTPFQFRFECKAHFFDW